MTTTKTRHRSTAFAVATITIAVCLHHKLCVVPSCNDPIHCSVVTIPSRFLVSAPLLLVQTTDRTKEREEGSSSYEFSQPITTRHHGTTLSQPVGDGGQSKNASSPIKPRSSRYHSVQLVVVMIFRNSHRLMTSTYVCVCVCLSLSMQPCGDGGYTCPQSSSHPVGRLNGTPGATVSG